MYLEHFGLRQLPFQLTPNTRFRFDLPTHHAALNMLMATLRSGEGFVKIVGEVGTGKTLLCRTLLNSLGDGFVTAYLPDPCLSPVGVRLALAEELGLELGDEIGEHQIMRRITERLVQFRAAGKRAVLLVDEAQALPRASLESLRLLTNLETETAKLLQVVLFAQPELDEMLAYGEMRQVRQRITFSHRLEPMSRIDMEGYVAYRLALAGYTGRDLFAPVALTLLFRASRGIPRLVNILSHKALLWAFGRGAREVQRKDMRRAIADTEEARPASGPGWRRIVTGVFGSRPRTREWRAPAALPRHARPRPKRIP